MTTVVDSFIVLTAVAVLAFAAGLFLFKVKARWCGQCGATLSCPDCRSPARRPHLRNNRGSSW
ncbi:hypothetical protein [Plantactinospora mayteni]|uniref:hypothetical protein n=1 Tax=Plantactinospora mayteni TaxID=566021 RepID=UPI0019429F55|nr:hypothetical protein [Plantactinospora mayteni]